MLRVADKLDLPLHLTIGQISQQVTVAAQQEVLETADASRGLEFDPIKTQQLPLNGRQEYMLMALTPACCSRKRPSDGAAIPAHADGT